MGMKAKDKIKFILLFYVLSAFVFFFFGNELVRLDEQLFLQINQIRNPFLDSFFLTITTVGSTLFWLSLIGIFWLAKQKKISFLLLAAFLIDSMTLIGSKLLFNRLRPQDFFSGVETLEYEIGPSFPSGHSERVFSGATILSAFYKNLKPVFYGLALLVAISRIYVGVHFPLDVIYGSLNGIVIGYLVRNLKKF